MPISQVMHLPDTMGAKQVAPCRSLTAMGTRAFQCLLVPYCGMSVHLLDIHLLLGYHEAWALRLLRERGNKEPQ